MFGLRSGGDFPSGGGCGMPLLGSQKILVSFLEESRRGGG